MIWSNYIIISCIYLVVFLLLRSLFFVIYAYPNIPRLNFWLWTTSLVMGIAHFSYSAEHIAEAKTVIPLLIFSVGASMVFYKATQMKKDDAYVLTDQAKKIFIKIRNVAKVFTPSELAVVNYSQLEAFKFNSIEWVDNIAIVRYPTAFYGLFFSTTIPPETEMTPQVHYDCVEYCYVVQGQMTDKTTGKIYNKGECAVWNAGEIHNPTNNKKEKLMVHVYFKEV